MIFRRPIWIFLISKEGTEEKEKPKTVTWRSFDCWEIVRKGNRPRNFTTASSRFHSFSYNFLATTHSVKVIIFNLKIYDSDRGNLPQNFLRFKWVEKSPKEPKNRNIHKEEASNAKKGKMTRKRTFWMGRITCERVKCVEKRRIFQENIK